jgi:RNA polymerase sigma-70 factor (ECF subfamily)
MREHLGAVGDTQARVGQALATVDLEERSLSDLADQAHITANNAAVRMHRAREALRKQVTLTCGVCAAHRCTDCQCHSHSRD